jgi:hypothetical protein
MPFDAWAAGEVEEGQGALQALGEAEEQDELQALGEMEEEQGALQALGEVEEQGELQALGEMEEHEGLQALEEPFLHLSLPSPGAHSQNGPQWSGFGREVYVRLHRR